MAARLEPSVIVGFDIRSFIGHPEEIFAVAPFGQGFQPIERSSCTGFDGVGQPPRARCIENNFMAHLREPVPVEFGWQPG